MLMIFPADISPLSFSPVGEMQITLRSVKDLEMQITLRSVKDLEMQITLVLSKTWRCRLLYVVDNLLIIRYPCHLVNLSTRLKIKIFAKTVNHLVVSVETSDLQWFQFLIYITNHLVIVLMVLPRKQFVSHNIFSISLRRCPPV